MITPLSNQREETKRLCDRELPGKGEEGLGDCLLHAIMRFVCVMITYDRIDKKNREIEYQR